MKKKIITSGPGYISLYLKTVLFLINIIASLIIIIIMIIMIMIINFIIKLLLSLLLFWTIWMLQRGVLVVWDRHNSGVSNVSVISVLQLGWLFCCFTSTVNI